MKKPKIGQELRNQGLVKDIIEIAPPPPPKERYYIIEGQEARAELRLNGKTLQILESLNDYYGVGTSVKSAITEMQEFTQKENIGTESDIEVIVVEVRYTFAAQALESEDIYNKAYPKLKRMNYPPSQIKLPPKEETIVWSSRTPDERIDKPYT